MLEKSKKGKTKTIPIQKRISLEASFPLMSMRRYTMRNLNKLSFKEAKKPEILRNAKECFAKAVFFLYNERCLKEFINILNPLPQ